MSAVCVSLLREAAGTKASPQNQSDQVTDHQGVGRGEVMVN